MSASKNQISEIIIIATYKGLRCGSKVAAMEKTEEDRDQSFFLHSRIMKISSDNITFFCVLLIQDDLAL